MNNNPTIKYILYARKSTESEDKQMASIDDQITEMKRLAEKQGLIIVDIIKESKSAKAPGRVKFNELLARIHNKEANAILTWKLNRLARNPIDGGQISWMLQEKIIHHIQTYGSDYKPSDNVLLMQIEFGMATQFVKDLSVSVSRGMRLKAEKGWFPASRLPIGYKRNPHKNARITNDIVADKKRYAIIKSLWNAILSKKYTIADLQRKAFRLGLRNKDGKPYGRSFFYRLFKNEFYCGYFYWKNADDIVERYHGKHKAMVTEKEFEIAQSQLFKWSSPVKEAKDNFIYRGLIKCGECSRTLTSQRKLQCICTKCKTKFSCKVNKYCPRCELTIEKMNNPSMVDQTYYHCTNTKDKCSQLPINQKKLEKQLFPVLKAISIPKEFYSYVISSINMFTNSNSVDENKGIIQLKKTVKKLELKLKRLTELRIREEISAIEYQSFKLEIKTEISTNKQELEEAENSHQYGLEKRRDYLEFSNQLYNRFKKGSVETKKLLLSKLASNLVLKDKTLYFTIPKPLFELLLYKELYQSNKRDIEPKKSLIYQGENTFFCLPLPVGEPTETNIELLTARLVSEIQKKDTETDETAES